MISRVEQVSMHLLSNTNMYSCEEENLCDVSDKKLATSRFLILAKNAVRRPPVPAASAEINGIKLNDSLIRCVFLVLHLISILFAIRRSIYC